MQTAESFGTRLARKKVVNCSLNFYANFNITERAKSFYRRFVILDFFLVLIIISSPSVETSNCHIRLSMLCWKSDIKRKYFNNIFKYIFTPLRPRGLLRVISRHQSVFSSPLLFLGRAEKKEDKRPISMKWTLNFEYFLNYVATFHLAGRW